MAVLKEYDESKQQWQGVGAGYIANVDGSNKFTPDELRQYLNYATASGTNTYTATISGIGSLVEGMTVKIKFTNANTGASTLNINGLGAKPIQKSNGNALSSGNIKAGQICHLVYTGTVFQLLGEGGEYGTAQPSHVLSPYTIGTEEGIKTGTMPDRRNYQGSEQATSNIISLTQHGSVPTSAVIKVSPTFEGFMDNTTVIQQNILNLNPSTIKTGVKVGSSTEYITGTYNGKGNATTSQVLSGRTFSTATLSHATGTMPNRGVVSKTITTQGGSYTIPSGYHSGSGKVTANFANLVAENIKKGVNIGGVVGTLKDGSNMAEYAEGDVYADSGTAQTINLPFTPTVVTVNYGDTYQVAGPGFGGGEGDGLASLIIIPGGFTVRVYSHTLPYVKYRAYK